ncbi:stage V sporulation protein B [[Clostridium] aminophilum]|uniref:Stage V sporulation protein B n=1 Tax=[Clostridium] aminophilum TaxID=1526 RepID=A0A1I0CJL8_9FIRM|nr:polysaccharide biosynthesis protein [[Clostridium] aminophilum]SET19612.1 stage V sporulation protein B [[Clostridium] aminophilum]
MSGADGRGKTGSNFLIQGSILAAAGIIVRLIGILYRIPMTNIIGDEGMGYYSTAFNVYNIMLILSSYSLPVAVSRMVSAKLARKEFRNVYRIFAVAMIYATIVGGTAFFVTWFGADFFASKVFATSLAVYALRALAPTIWLMAYLGVLRGFFQGHGTMLPTAVSQILEQIVNAVISVVAAFYLFRMGNGAFWAEKGDGYAEAFGAAGGTIGTGMGAFAAFLFVLGLFFLYRPIIRRRCRRDATGLSDSFGKVGNALLSITIPVILSSTIYNINSVIDNGIMAHGMAMTGQGDRFLSLWGIFNNKYMLLVNVPLAMANSLSSSLIPSISGACARKDVREMVKKTGLVIRFSMLIAIPCTVGLTVLAEPSMNLLFHSGDNTEAIRMMIYGSSVIIFLSMSTVSNAILQGLGRFREPVKNALIALILHIVVLVIMLIPLRMGIYALVHSKIFFAVLMCWLNQRSIRAAIPYRQEFRRTFFVPGASSAVMGIFAWLIYHGIYAVVPINILAIAGSVGFAVLVYGAVLLLLRGITEEELRHMPGGTKLMGLVKKCRLM